MESAITELTADSLRFRGLDVMRLAVPPRHAAVEKALGTPGTCRNWNTVTKLLAMGEELDSAG